MAKDYCSEERQEQIESEMSLFDLKNGTFLGPYDVLAWLLDNCEINWYDKNLKDESGLGGQELESLEEILNKMKESLK